MTESDLARWTKHIRVEDERQEAIVALLKGQPTSEADAIAIIKRSQYRDESRRRIAKQRYQPLPEFEEPDTSPEPLGKMYRLSAQLEPDLRTVLLLHVVAELTFADIADRLSISVRTAKRRYEAAKKELEHLALFPLSQLRK